MIVSKEKCYLCGISSNFEIYDGATLLREAHCCNCGASLRTSDVASVIVKKLTNKNISLSEALPYMKDLVIYNASYRGHIHQLLKNLPNYHYGEFYYHVSSGKIAKPNILCVDIQNLPYRDNMFDLFITESLFEHVENWDKAMTEISRVLKRDGRHIFTVPIHEEKKTVTRKGNPKKIYHTGGSENDTIDNVLVYTDFGSDLAYLLNKYNFKTNEYMCHKLHEVNEITDCDSEYTEYLKYKNKLLSFFKYNIIVFESINKKSKYALKNNMKNNYIANTTNENIEKSNIASPSFKYSKFKNIKLEKIHKLEQISKASDHVESIINENGMFKITSLGNDPYIEVFYDEIGYKKVLIKVCIYSPEKTNCQVFFHGKEESYTENNSVKDALDKGFNNILFIIENKINITNIRFDIGETKGDYVIKDFVIYK